MFFDKLFGSRSNNNNNYDDNTRLEFDWDAYWNDTSYETRIKKITDGSYYKRVSTNKQEQSTAVQINDIINSYVI